MTRRIIKSDLALKDLEEQAEYIRLRSPRAALRFLGAAEALFQQLASMPGIGEPFEATNPLFQDLLLPDPEIPLAGRVLQAPERRNRCHPRPSRRSRCRPDLRAGGRSRRRVEVSIMRIACRPGRPPRERSRVHWPHPATG